MTVLRQQSIQNTTAATISRD